MSSKFRTPKRRPKPLNPPERTVLNTPRSVLAFVDVHLSRVPDPLELARELGYEEDAIEHLTEKHGDGLGSHLQRVERQRRDTDDFLARQQGREHPEQYVSSHLGAIDELPCAPRGFVNDLPLENARRLYDAMVEAELAIKKALDNAHDPSVVGDIKRSYAQAQRARERAGRLLAIQEQEKAA